MRIDVKKYLFIGLEDQKALFFKQAQESGFIHFIDTRTKPGAKELPGEIQRVSSAIKVLRHLPPVEQEQNRDIFRTEILVDDILRLHEQQEKFLEQVRLLDVEIARIEVFGDFSKKDIAFIEQEGQQKIQFFAANPSLFKDQQEPEGLVYVATEHGLNYYVAINPHPVVYEKMAEIKIDKTLGELKKEHLEVQHQLRETEHELKEYAKYNELLHHYFISILNKYNLHTAETYVQEAMEGSLFAIEGWVPENQTGKINQLLDGLNVYADEVAREPKDVIPTHLENRGVARVGEDLVHIYDTPSSIDKDPSLWVLGSFTLFFSFIIGDAGYGLIYLAIALIIRYKYPNIKGTGKRVLNLLTILATGCIVWGVLVNSFFGIPIDTHNPVRKVSLLHWLAVKKADYHIQQQDHTFKDWVKKYPELANATSSDAVLSYNDKSEGYITQPIIHEISDNILFELSLFIGVVHIIFSLLRYLRKNIYGAGWIAFLIGAYLYFGFYLNAPTILNYVFGIDLQKGGEFGYQLMIGGIIFACVAAIIQHGMTGIFELTAVIQIFADILSYLRLYALGLAGAIVSGTINEIASTVPLAVAVLIILASHFVNMVLVTMSGVIHGLRLNFIEWYHYSFEGGGKEFRPLKLLKIE